MRCWGRRAAQGVRDSRFMGLMSPTGGGYKQTHEPIKKGSRSCRKIFINCLKFVHIFARDFSAFVGSCFAFGLAVFWLFVLAPARIYDHKTRLFNHVIIVHRVLDTPKNECYTHGAELH